MTISLVRLHKIAQRSTWLEMEDSANNSIEARVARLEVPVRLDFCRLVDTRIPWSGKSSGSGRGTTESASTGVSVLTQPKLSKRERKLVSPSRGHTLWNVEMHTIMLKTLLIVRLMES